MRTGSTPVVPTITYFCPMEKHLCLFTKPQIEYLIHQMNRAKYRLYEKMEKTSERGDTDWISNKIEDCDQILYQFQKALNSIDQPK